MDLTFFGLTSESRAFFKKNIYDQIHEICFWGQGGYSWDEVYNLPVFIRNYIFNKLKKHYEEKDNVDDQGNTKTIVSADGTVNVPAFLEASKNYKRTKYS